MSTPNPLQSQGALDGASAPKSRMRVTVLTILAVHVVFIGGLLLQGCDKEGARTGLAGASSNALSTLPPLADTNYFSSFPGDTQPAPVASPMVPTNPAAETVVPDQASITPAYPLPGTAASAVPAHSIGIGSGTEHVIKKGDTIGDLARKYGVTVQAILDANPNAKPRSLRLDEKLVIPAAAPGSTTAASLGGTLPVTGEVYIVKQGDNLSRIAKKFGVSVKELRAANGIKGDRILPKQRLVIPPKSAPAAPGPANTTGDTF